MHHLSGIRRFAKRLMLLILFFFNTQIISGQNIQTSEKIKDLYISEIADSSLIRNFNIEIETISVFDSANWDGVYAAYVLDKDDSMSNKHYLTYFVFYDNRLYYELYKSSRNSPKHKPNRIHRILIRKFGSEAIQKIEHYFYYRYPGQF